MIVLSVEARVKLRELLEELTETLRKASDPFKIDIRYFIGELEKILPELTDEDLIVDAEILEQIAEVIKEQEEWVKGRSSLLVLGPFIALLKISTLSKQELAKELANAMHPIIELEQITWTDVLRALNYLSLRKRFVLEEVQGQETKIITGRKLEELGLIAKIDLRKVVEEVEEEIAKKISKNKLVDYSEIIADDEPLKRFFKAYAISYLATMGRISIFYNPLKEKYFIVKAPQNGEYQSIVISLEATANAC